MVVVAGGRAAGANVVLSSLGVDVEKTWDVGLSRDRGLHARGAAVALVSCRGMRFAVVGTHLDLQEAPRVRHVEEIEQALRTVLADTLPAGQVPTVVAGDMNDVPGSETWSAWLRGRADAGAGPSAMPTFRAIDPTRRIDGVFVSPQVTVRSCTVLDSPDVRAASDHRPVLVELEIG